MERRVWSLHGNSQRLDGGAMFGNAPRALWERWAMPDARNRIELSCRALLVQEPERNVLLETGIGAFLSPKLKDRYGVEEPEHVLLDSLAALGLSHEDIDVVVLSHLHFDHAGGLLSAWSENAPPKLLFPRARFIVSRKAWLRAKNPHPRDQASFIPELQPQLEASGRLVLVDGRSSATLGPAYRFHYSDGHTPGLLITEVEGRDGPLVFPSDLVPGRAWVHGSITMGYDRYPELLIDEKRKLLTDLARRSGRLFFTHDPNVAMAIVTKNEAGRFGTIMPRPQLRDLVA